MSDQATAWARLIDLAETNAAASRSLSGLFAAEPDRLARLSLDVAGIYLDLSKQAWSRDEMEASLALAGPGGRSGCSRRQCGDRRPWRHCKAGNR